MRKDGEQGTAVTRFDSVFCPECQGSGLSIDGDEKERDKVSLSEVLPDLKFIYLLPIVLQKRTRM